MRACYKKRKHIWYISTSNKNTQRFTRKKLGESREIGRVGNPDIPQFNNIYFLQAGQPTDDWKSDPEGGQESAVSKAVRGVTKFASQVRIRHWLAFYTLSLDFFKGKICYESMFKHTQR